MTEKTGFLKDDTNGKYFASFLVRPCPHPAVIRKYGRNGVCNVSVATCKTCRHMMRAEYDAIVCGYGGKKIETD